MSTGIFLVVFVKIFFNLCNIKYELIAKKIYTKNSRISVRVLFTNYGFALFLND